jgi:hypothetical protein
MTEDELAWARTTTGCVGILHMGSPFIILEGAPIHSRQERLFVFVVVVVSVAGVSVGGWSGRRG